MENWKDIVGYEGLYQISNFGNVKRIYFDKEKMLNLTLNNRSYLRICLSKNGIKKTKQVHQLVAMAFKNHIPCGMKFVINHIDYNKLNNREDNLEIVTNRENTNRKHLKSSSKYTGVYWNNNTKKWQSAIKINNKTKYLGAYENEIIASNAYELALTLI